MKVMARPTALAAAVRDIGLPLQSLGISQCSRRSPFQKRRKSSAEAARQVPMALAGNS